MKRLGLVIVGLLFFVVFGNLGVGSHSGASQNPPVVTAAVGDAEIAAARDKARANIAKFWTSLEKPAAGERSFTIKAAFDIPQHPGSTEHIWLGDIRREGAQISGRVDNAPRDVTHLKLGQRVTFTEERVTDWMFMRNGKIAGNETMHPLIKRLPPAEQAKLRAMMESN